MMGSVGLPANFPRRGVELCLGCLVGQFSGDGATGNSCAFAGGTSCQESFLISVPWDELGMLK